MKINSFFPIIGVVSNRETLWGKGVIFFIAAMILLNALGTGPSLSPEKQEMLRKIVEAQSTVLQFFSFSALPIMAVDNFLKHTGLGGKAPRHPKEDPCPAGSSCDRCLVQPSVESNRSLLKELFLFAIPVLVCAGGFCLFSARFRERWKVAQRTITGAGRFFFLLPRSAVGDEGAVLFPLYTSARPDAVRPGIFVFFSPLCRGGS